MHDSAIHAVINGIHDFLGDGDRADRDKTAGQGFSHANHVRFDVPVINGPEFSGASQAGLDFIGNEQGAVFFA